MAKKELSEEGKEELDLEIILLKDLKSEGKMDVEVTKMILSLVDYLGVAEQYNKLHAMIPPMIIKPKF